MNIKFYWANKSKIMKKQEHFKKNIPTYNRMVETIFVLFYVKMNIITFWL